MINPTTQKKILIVDDDLDIQFFVAKRLKSVGFVCESALTVEDGLKMIRICNPDLIVLDLGFAGYNGADFLQSVIEWTPPGQRPPPIIVLSCNSQEDIVEYVRDLGASDFVAKPYEAKDLVARIQSCLLSDQQ